ncbi:MAG TPA: M20 aminoacylase family protein [Rhodopila sp.]|uniref:M20 aminoacylase family protein n=1 Tax=Rhodopila sp. TaxID=2480087 RepID=UPI002B6A30B8|nr:M20 aminoacylase family protein [Rhodopila sp.]HVY17553.1 M20 aminoacylase family protein [Rhodopila sp.]
MTIPDRILGYQDELTAIRRDIHAHPELGLEEYRTADLVAAKLAEWGIEVHRNVGKTGVVGVLRNGNGQAAVGLRADMDALPILEATGLPHASQNPGKMHACGHDGHTTMLLGAAKFLAETRNFNGTVNFIFQPAEEGLGGALEMLKDGLFDRFPCDAVYGMHNRPGLAVGKFITGPSARAAGGAFFDIRITGKGAHGANPQFSVDPVLVACHIGAALQSIVSRNIAAMDTAVLSITRIQSGDAYNVIPQHAVMAGTVRAMKREVMETVETNMRRLVTSVAAGFGAEAEVDFRIIFAPMVNNEAEAIAYGDAAAALVGEENIRRDAPPGMGSEDFSFMMEQVPGAHVNLGNGTSAALHNHLYDFNDEIIPYGVALYSAIVEKKMPKGQAA